MPEPEGWNSAKKLKLRWPWPTGLILLATALHLVVVADLIRQPLDVNAGPPAARSLIWPLHNDTIHRRGPGADFFAVYHAGRSFEHGADPYGFAELPDDAPYFYRFRYLPLIGQGLGRLAAQLSPLTAWRLWVVALEIGLAGLIWLIRGRLRDGPWPDLATCLLLLSSPYFLELHMGQFTFLAVGLATAGILILEPAACARRPDRRKTALGSLLFALAVLLKVFPLVLLPVLLLRRRWWPAAAGAAAAVILAAGPYFLAHPDQWQAFRQANLTTPAGSLHAGNYSLSYLLHALIWQPFRAGENAAWFAFLGLWRLLVLGGTAGAVLLARRRRPLTAAAVLLLAHFVSYPQVWEHHLSGVLVAGLLLVLGLRTETAPAPGLIRLTGWALVLLALPTPFVWLDRAKDVAVTFPGDEWPPAAKALLAAVKAAPTLALFAVGLVQVGRGGGACPGRQPRSGSASGPSQGP